MKIQHLILTLIAATAFALTGCKKDGTVNVDTAQLTASFQTAEADAKAAVETVTTSIKNADYAGAVTQLKSLGEKYKLTPEQQQVVNDLIAQVKKAIEASAGKVAETAGKVAEDASKTATDLGGAIKK
jgi:outer membrane protein assembly factor BamD (BamD/ComL family)